MFIIGANYGGVFECLWRGDAFIGTVKDILRMMENSGVELN